MVKLSGVYISFINVYIQLLIQTFIHMQNELWRFQFNTSWVYSTTSIYSSSSSKCKVVTIFRRNNVYIIYEICLNYHYPLIIKSRRQKSSAFIATEILRQLPRKYLGFNLWIKNGQKALPTFSRKKTQENWKGEYNIIWIKKKNLEVWN